jgi:hypothetical protein
MNTRIYISDSCKGWEEVKIPEEYRRYSHEALVKVVHRFIDRNTCKGLLITENPDPFRKEKSERMSA